MPRPFSSATSSNEFMYQPINQVDPDMMNHDLRSAIASGHNTSYSTIPSVMEDLYEYEEELLDLKNDGGSVTMKDRSVGCIRTLLKPVNLFVFFIFLYVIVAGAVNRIIYKIQLVPMGPYALFISWFLNIAYCITYFLILFIRRIAGPVKHDMLVYAVHPLKGGWKFVLMGFMDATGFIVGIYAAERISGYLLTLLPQGIIPMTMVITVVIVGTRYHIFQVAAAAVVIIGIIVSLVPDLQSGTSGSLIWATIYFCSSAPNALSFALRELVFTQYKGLDIFIVNSFDSLWQLVFSVLYFPLVLIPHFGKIPFQELPYFVADAAQCIVGISPQLPPGTPVTNQHSCFGEPYLLIVYIGVNLSWNISLLYLLKKGGAVLTFIAGAVSLPIAHLAFAIDWPILGAEKLHYVDIGALVMVLAGLIFYRLSSMFQAYRIRKINEKRKEVGLPPLGHPIAGFFRSIKSCFLFVAGRNRSSHEV